MKVDRHKGKRVMKVYRDGSFGAKCQGIKSMRSSKMRATGNFGYIILGLKFLVWIIKIGSFIIYMSKYIIAQESYTIGAQMCRRGNVLLTTVKVNGAK